jgi:hypothetical protein
MKVLFLVGKMTDYHPKKYTSRSAPIWMKEELDNFEEFVDDEEEMVPSDVAMAMYLSHKHPKDEFDCILGDKVPSTSFLNGYDVVFVVYDMTEVFNCGMRKTCPRETKQLEKMLADTKAFVFPYPDYHKYIVDKPKYYTDLARANIPVVPFFRSTPDDVLANVQGFRDTIEKKGWSGIIIKPSYAGYSSGIKVFKNFSRIKDSTVEKAMEKFKKLGFPAFTVAEFVPTFGQHFEIRTYWINGKYAYAVATLTESVGKAGGLNVSDEDTFKSEGGKLPDELKKKLKEEGKKVIKAIPQYKYGHPIMRIDFGCCIETSEECKASYFVNEVETLAANLLPEGTKFPVVEKLGNALYNFAKNVKGKKNNPKPRKSNYKSKVKTCIKTKSKKKGVN